MRIVLVAALACLMATSASAQSAMTLDQFVTRANRIPRNPAAVIHPDTNRVKREAERAFRNVLTEIVSAREAGRAPPACPPNGNISVNALQVLGHLNTIPQARRQRMTVTDGIRDWMRARYPCPGG